MSTQQARLADTRLNKLLSERRWCYYVDRFDYVEGRGYRVSIVIEKEPGRYPTGGNGTEPWCWGDATGSDTTASFKEAQAVCESANTQLGIAPDDAFKILGSSMFPSGRRRSKRSTAR